MPTPSVRLRDYIATVETNLDILDDAHTMHEPQRFVDAENSPLWVRAMESEMQSIMDNHTWILVDLPPSHWAISVKWIYRLKPGADGHPPTHKARLVARGDDQRAGIGFLETFSHVVKWSTLRNIIALAAAHRWPIRHMDVKNAFLNDLLKEEVYLKQPPAFITPGQEHKVCKLSRSIYGLRQSSRA